jgi:hypothetical protein
MVGNMYAILACPHLPILERQQAPLTMCARRVDLSTSEAGAAPAPRAGPATSGMNFRGALARVRTPMDPKAAMAMPVACEQEGACEGGKGDVDSADVVKQDTHTAPFT